MMRRLRSSWVLPAMVLAAIIVLSGCGESNENDASDEAAAAGVSLRPPAGWKVKNKGDQGIVVAQEESDLLTDAVQGPRFAARPAAGGYLDAGAVLDSLPPAAGSGVISSPGRIRVDGHRAASVLVRESRDGQPTVSGTVTVALGPGRAYLFSLEAPASKWTATKQALFNILSTVKFNVPAVPQS